MNTRVRNRFASAPVRVSHSSCRGLAIFALIAHGTAEVRGQCDPQWLPTGTGMNGRVNAFAVYNNELIAAGEFTMAGGQPANYIARWNGSSWAPFGTGLDDAASAFALYNDELIVGGWFTTAGGQPAAHLARWGCPPCYPNCDSSTLAPILNINDYVCFNAAFAAGGSYANCDGSTAPPTLNVADFICFLNQFAAGCP